MPRTTIRILEIKQNKGTNKNGNPYVLWIYKSLGGDTYSIFQNKQNFETLQSIKENSQLELDWEIGRKPSEHNITNIIKVTDKLTTKALQEIEQHAPIQKSLNDQAIKYASDNLSTAIGMVAEQFNIDPSQLKADNINVAECNHQIGSYIWILTEKKKLGVK